MGGAPLPSMPLNGQLHTLKGPVINRVHLEIPSIADTILTFPQSHETLNTWMEWCETTFNIYTAHCGGKRHLLTTETQQWDDVLVSWTEVGLEAQVVFMLHTDGLTPLVTFRCTIAWWAHSTSVGRDYTIWCWKSCSQPVTTLHGSDSKTMIPST